MPENLAQQLYGRWGFQTVSEDAVVVKMIWRAGEWTQAELILSRFVHASGDAFRVAGCCDRKVSRQQE
jgi:hypothetical protein